MSKIAVIGAGISGLTVAQELSHEPSNNVVVFEKEANPGGLIRCKRINGSLFHICGGHIFNSKRQDVLDWFWQRFDKENEFIKADRNSVVAMPNGLMVPYPIEDHVYYFDQSIQDRFYRDLVRLELERQPRGNNFEEFLRNRFGETLYNLYFGPYNRKVWKCDLTKVSLDWLEGKLPMPTVQEMRDHNANHVEEKQFVHSTFYYEKEGGSQLIANRLAEGLDIRYLSDVKCLDYKNAKIYINEEAFDKVVYCGNIKQLVSILSGIELNDYKLPVEQLQAHGTTAVFCEIDKNPYSWIYQPSEEHHSHRIICTGNFSATNNKEGVLTGTVEFTDEMALADIKTDLEKMPFHPKYIAHHYSPYTYPIQTKETRQLIQSLKNKLAPYNIYFTGRFADWEYYNMDVAIGAALDLCKNFLQRG